MQNLQVLWNLSTVENCCVIVTDVSTLSQHLWGLTEETNEDNYQLDSCSLNAHKTFWTWHSDSDTYGKKLIIAPWMEMWQANECSISISWENWFCLLSCWQREPISYARWRSQESSITNTTDLVTQDLLTVSTNSNFFLSWTSWMRQTYSSAALAKSLCSISRVASAWKIGNIN